MKVKKHSNNLKLLAYYTKYENKYTNIYIILRITKFIFFISKLNSVASSPKLTCKLIKEITNTKVNEFTEMKSVLIDN